MLASNASLCATYFISTYISDEMARPLFHSVNAGEPTCEAVTCMQTGRQIGRGNFKINIQ